MDDNRFDPENQTENEKPSVYRILREYWDDVERQEAARTHAGAYLRKVLPPS